MNSLLPREPGDGPLARAIRDEPADPVGRLSSEVLHIDRDVTAVARVVRGQQVALLWITVLLAGVLPIATIRSDRRDREVLHYSLLTATRLFFDRDLALVRLSPGRAAEIGRVVTLGALLLVIIAAITLLGSTRSMLAADPERRPTQVLTLAALALALGLVGATLGAVLLAVRTEWSFWNPGSAVLVAATVLALLAAKDARNRV